MKWQRARVCVCEMDIKGEDAAHDLNSGARKWNFYVGQNRIHLELGDGTQSKTSENDDQMVNFINHRLSIFRPHARVAHILFCPIFCFIAFSMFFFSVLLCFCFCSSRRRWLAQRSDAAAVVWPLQNNVDVVCTESVIRVSESVVYVQIDHVVHVSTQVNSNRIRFFFCSLASLVSGRTLEHFRRNDDVIGTQDFKSSPTTSRKWQNTVENRSEKKI